jgi:methyl-accepting chemotaxis protein
MDANQRFDRMDEKLEILIDQVGHLTEGLVDLKLTVERQAETVDRLLTEGLADIKATIERQVVVAERQAETMERQVETVDRLVKIVETVLQQRMN